MIAVVQDSVGEKRNLSEYQVDYKIMFAFASLLYNNVRGGEMLFET
jgi:hypothetical protein